MAERVDVVAFDEREPLPEGERTNQRTVAVATFVVVALVLGGAVVEGALLLGVLGALAVLGTWQFLFRDERPIETTSRAVEAGRGLGMSRWERLRRVQLPIALPVIMAGVRNAVVILIGIAAIGAYIGAGGLGAPIFNGITDANTPQIVVATLFLSGLALAVDYGLGVTEQLLRIRNGETVEKSVGTRLVTEVV